MLHRNQKFPDVVRRTPPKVPPTERIQSFQEISADFANATGVDQSSRCAQCVQP